MSGARELDSSYMADLFTFMTTCTCFHCFYARSYFTYDTDALTVQEKFLRISFSLNFKLPVLISTALCSENQNTQFRLVPRETNSCFEESRHMTQTNFKDSKLHVLLYKHVLYVILEYMESDQI